MKRDNENQPIEPIKATIPAKKFNKKSNDKPVNNKKRPI